MKRPVVAPFRPGSWQMLLTGAMMGALLGASTWACNRDLYLPYCPKDVLIVVHGAPLDTTSPLPDAGTPSYTIELDGVACGFLSDNGYTLHLSGAEGTCIVTIVFEGGVTKSQEVVVGHFLRGCDFPVPEIEEIRFRWP